MGIKSLGNKKSISYAAVWDETGTGAGLPANWYGGTEKWYGARGIVAGGRDGSNGTQNNNINYLNMNICDNGDGWEKLCKFLDKEIPDVDFPHKNKSIKI